jgi:hypothetical protein
MADVRNEDAERRYTEAVSEVKATGKLWRDAWVP